VTITALPANRCFFLVPNISPALPVFEVGVGSAAIE
jgi:hypothetical protein